MATYRHIIILLVAVYTLSLVAPAWSKDEDRGLSGCAAHMKALSQAVEIWANEHKGAFPTKEEWGSTAFMEIVKKVGAGKADQVIKCPATGKPYNYIPLASKKSYEIACPNASSHGLGVLCYSRDSGLVKKEAGVASTPAAKSTARPMAKPSPKAHEKTGPKEKPVAGVESPSALPEEVTQEDRDKITEILKDLYSAYAERNLDTIMELQHDSIEASALDYEKKKKGSADEVREAFKSATKEIIEHKDFKMLPLNLSDMTFMKKGNTCRVTSIVPIIATERLEVMEEGKYFFVRLRIGEFIFEKKNDLWKIVNMYLY
jgi:hypothetical protein